jgi:hypothetical protein
MEGAANESEIARVGEPAVWPCEEPWLCAHERRRERAQGVAAVKAHMSDVGATGRVLDQRKGGEHVGAIQSFRLQSRAVPRLVRRA